jgi:ABC-type glutathione transport system ATPase component
MQSGQPVLDVQDLEVKVGDSVLIDRISFQIHAGEIFALVGESGSGKSLTSLAIMRLLPEALQITEGQIWLNQQALFALPETGGNDFSGAHDLAQPCNEGGGSGGRGASIAPAYPTTSGACQSSGVV